MDNPIVSGYKVHWGLESGTYLHTVDAGNATELVTAGFAEGVQYFSAVTAYAETGEESDYSEEISFVYDSSDRIIFLEAENGVLTAPMQIGSNGSISWIAASPPNSAASVTLNFNIPYSSECYVWCRVLAPNASADSMWVTVDQQPEQIYHVYGEPSPPESAFKPGWTWSQIQISPGIARTYTLDGGSHSIRFRDCESARIDRIIVVCNPDFVPTDAVPRRGDFVQVVNQPQAGAVVEGGTMTLAASFVATGPLGLQWYHNGVPLPSGQGMSLDLLDAQAENAGSYSLAAWLNSAIAFTRPAAVTVMPAAGSQHFRVSHMSIGSGGQVTFEVDGASGADLSVYVSSDLEHWSLLATQALSGNSLTISDPGGGPKRFYRLADSGH